MLIFVKRCSLKNELLVNRWASEISTKDKVTRVPQMAWLVIGNEAVAMGDTPIGNRLGHHSNSTVN